MKRSSFLSCVAVVLVCLGFAAANARGGATANAIYSFNVDNTGIDTPAGGLVMSGNWIYGMGYDKSGQNGGVFKVRTDGTGFYVLKAFNWSYPYTLSNGYGGLVLSPDGSVLYGLYPQDANGLGAVFSIHTDGSGFAFIHTFSGASPQSFTGLTGGSAAPATLLADTNYSWHMTALDSLGDQSSPSATFYFITPSAPAVQTLAATAGTGSGAATLNGSVNPNGAGTTVYFQYGPTASYGFLTSQTSIGTTAGNFSALVTNLNVDTTYHYRIVAANSVGTSLGSDVTFVAPR